jgi:DNA-damage-inducible protein D
MTNEVKMAIFKGKEIRKIIHQNEWWFSVVDVVEALTDSPTPRQYWGKVKQREFIDLQLSPFWVQLKLESSDGKKYETDCANFELI